MPERPVVIRAGLAILAIAAVSLLFIASYAGALHEPRPHEVPLAVEATVPAAIAAQLDRSPEIRVVAKRSAAAAMDAIDTRDVYGALLARGRGLVLVVAPAAGPAVAEALKSALLPQLRRSGVPVAVRTVHPLPAADSRGLVGTLTVAAVGAVTVALQSVLGLIGTGLAILIFVVLGNPASGGPFSAELLPGLWRMVGQLIPTGAATTALRNIAYFPEASVTGPVLVIAIWLVAGVVVALALGQRRGPLTEDEAAASMGAAVAP